MTEEKFRDRLERHRAVGYCYLHSGVAGMIQVWFHENVFVLTWEECKDGDQANENNYSRDDRFEFANVSDVTDYLQTAGIKTTDFTP